MAEILPSVNIKLGQEKPGEFLQTLHELIAQQHPFAAAIYKKCVALRTLISNSGYARYDDVA